MKMYLGFYFANSLNTQTPLAEWFDDAAWSKTVLPEIKGLAAGAKALGFDGITFDQELYPQNDGRSTASWSWAYDGNTHTEAEVRSQVKARGQQIMETVLSVFPKVEILAYGSFFPDVWDELVQLEVNRDASANRDFVFINLWDGMTIPDGYESIQFLNAIFYKTPHITDATWDTAYTYEYNRFFAMLSQRLSNWAGAADRVSETPFVWISNGSTDFEVAKDPPYVADQLAAARRWGMERTFANYTFDNLRTFDYGPYVAGMRAASKAGVVDDVPPRIQVDQPTVAAGSEGHQPHRGRDGQPGGPGGALEDRRRTHRCRPDGMGQPGRPRRGLDLADEVDGRRRPAARRRQPDRGLRRGHQRPVRDPDGHGRGLTRCASCMYNASRESVARSGTSSHCCPRSERVGSTCGCACSRSATASGSSRRCGARASRWW